MFINDRENYFLFGKEIQMKVNFKLNASHTV